jgi:hypothetical protein
MDINTEDTFVMMVRSLLEKGLDKVNTASLSESMKQEIAKVGEKFFNNGSYYDAVGAFVLAGVEDRLLEVGRICFNQKKYEAAFNAFKYARDSEGLIDVGNAFLGEGRLRDAYAAFKLSGNEEMIQFFEVNFKEGVDQYV